MSIDEIKITKASEHNLKDISVRIPKNSLCVITGPSGSGKSSLAFDTIYVEGQRRYIESLSSYARQFLGQYQPPQVESITGLSPSIAIDQKTSSKNPRSTVGTITEIYDYLRVLYARIGTLYCPETGEVVAKSTIPQMVKAILANPEKSKIQIMAPLYNQEKGLTDKHFSQYLTMGFTRCLIDGEIHKVEEFKFKKNKLYTVDLVIDRLIIKKDIEKRLSDSVEHALKLGNGMLKVLVGEDTILTFSEHNMAPSSGKIYPDLEPRLFSFNSPIGACPTCNGLGETKTFDKNLFILDDSLSIPDGAIGPITKKNNFLLKMIESIAEEESVNFDLPLKKLPTKFKKILFEGSDKVYTYAFKSENSHWEFSKSFPGISKWLHRKFHETTSERVRKSLEEYMNIQTCPDCNGGRLNEVALSTKINKKNIIEISSLSIDEATKFFNSLKLTGEKKIIAEKLLTEIRNRLKFLLDVGLDYLTLNRGAATLSGGESQRIRLATQIGSALSGVLYVLDEPSIGLHQRDNDRLIQTLISLRDIGNTVIVVEHDEDTMRHADYIVDMGPGAGIHGGEIVAVGTLNEILKSKNSITANFLNHKEKISLPEQRRTSKEYIKLKGALHNNLKKVDITIPKNVLTCITGVSGSGKSTLIHEVLVPALKFNLNRSNNSLYRRYNYNTLTGIDKIKSVIELDQSPIGRTPHSNPATYTGLFDDIRKLFAKTPESQIRGYKQGRFSFNVKGGRCEACEGNGVKKIEMHFLPDVYITCNDCNGTRYNKETLSILYRGKNISDVLDMSIEEAKDFFSNHTRMSRILNTLFDVGLGYMKLGQSATTLSGGEAQRLKLSRELSKATRGECLYILDEPTTGLHFKDVKVLLKAINNLVDAGHSVVIIEHNLDIIKTADHIIDLGPEGGDKGGTVVATGTPEEVSKVKESHTGKYIKKMLS